MLLAHPPVDCSKAIQDKWQSLQHECGMHAGRCCPTCIAESADHCDDAYTPTNTVVATAYTAVTIMLLLLG